jgi:hypothetical protein
MSYDPAILFYTADFLVGTDYFTDDETGQYIRFLCHQHQHGHLSNEFIKRKFPDGLFDEVKKKLKTDSDGNQYQPRMDEEIKKRKKFCESRRKNIMNRYHKEDKPLKNKKVNTCTCVGTSVLHMENENENENRNENNKTSLELDSRVKDKRLELFNMFWKMYPKKRDKGHAQKAWEKINSPVETLEKIKTALVWQNNSYDWKKESGQYIPYPATYLNGMMWEDEKTKTKSRREELEEMLGESRGSEQ